MNVTPRLRSAYPSTPQSNPFQEHSDLRPRISSKIPSAAAPPPKLVQDNDVPLIPVQTLDAATQRFYVAMTYILLTIWRLYDWSNVRDDLESTWYFLKWVGIDSVFFVAVPGLRIPWLEWSFSTSAALILLHLIADAMLMFQIPIPITSWLAALAKLLYNREISVSERRVNPADILHNSSLILGKQIVHILPEGSAMLNPDQRALCLSEKHKTIELPIRVNQTNPILIELLRTDPDTLVTETLTITARQARSLKRNAEKTAKLNLEDPRLLMYPVRKTGIYQLERVVDESKLEVQRRRMDVLIPECPKAVISTEQHDKCLGDLSEVFINVYGIPPYSVRYSKQINYRDSSASSQSIHPPDVLSPLRTRESSNALLSETENADLLWARSRTMKVPINEQLSESGEWTYSIEEVQDGLGNVVSYEHRTKSGNTEQTFTVHNRPIISFTDCNSETMLKVANEDSIELPVGLNFPQPVDRFQPISFNYSFINEKGNALPPQKKLFKMHKAHQRPRVKQPGRYALDSVASDYCSGIVSEPSSCLLVNPPEPELRIKAENISDQCAGRPIGLSVDLDLVGSPPFHLSYTTSKDGVTQPQGITVDGLRKQIELRPKEAGFYTYHFTSIRDAVYDSISLTPKRLILTQDVRPPANVVFQSLEKRNACLDDQVSIEVGLLGDASWVVEYDLVHNGNRKSDAAHSDKNQLTITTPKLSHGGEYSIVFRAVQDKSKCRTSLNEQLKIGVRPERPRAAFGFIGRERAIAALEGERVGLPVRLQGIAPWKVEYVREEDTNGRIRIQTVDDPNAALNVDQAGTFRLVNVHDTCPGTVDPAANTFKVSWIPRPTMNLIETGITAESGERYRKEATCLGDEDTVELELNGHPPFNVQYQQHQKPNRGPNVVANKELTIATGKTSISLESSQPGENVYKFFKLTDSRYHDNNKHRSITLRQNVYPLPTARFDKPGQTFAYCKDDKAGNDLVPLTLEGQPPFSLEIVIAHRGSARPQVFKIKDVDSRHWRWPMPRQNLDFGTHSVSIRKITDARGCERTLDTDPSSVRIHVSDVPTIIPLEIQQDYCVGEHVSYSLSGQPPFEVFYHFQGRERKALEHSTTFRRITEQPGKFTIFALRDNASGKCRAEKELSKIIHPMPTVKISKGKTSVVDIHRGGEAELFFDFTGTPPFEFTYALLSAFSIPFHGAKLKSLVSCRYTRSENVRKGKRAAILETRNDRSDDYTKTIRASDEGTYEVVAIKDRYCSFSIQGGSGREKKGQKLLQK